MTARPGSIVLIEWRDAGGIADRVWISPDEAKNHEPATVTTIGFLVRATQTHVTVMQSFHADACGGVFTIPAPWIGSLTTLQAPETE